MRAEPRASNRSRTTERLITWPAQAPSAWKQRSAIRLPIVGASAQAAEAAAYTAQPNSSGPRRPYRSLIGP